MTFPKVKTPPKGPKELRLPALTATSVDRLESNAQVNRHITCKFIVPNRRMLLSNAALGLAVFPSANFMMQRLLDAGKECTRD
jgi:hypothetical protein